MTINDIHRKSNSIPELRNRWSVRALHCHGLSGRVVESIRSCFSGSDVAVQTPRPLPGEDRKRSSGEAQTTLSQANIDVLYVRSAQVRGRGQVKSADGLLNPSAFGGWTKGQLLAEWGAAKIGATDDGITFQKMVPKSENLVSRMVTELFFPFGKFDVESRGGDRQPSLVPPSIDCVIMEAGIR